MGKRAKFVNKALSWLGTKEKSAGHKQIIADYSKGCDKGRKADLSTPWCACFVGACAVETDNVMTADGVGVPCDCSCGTGSHSLLEKAKKAGVWIESDSYRPHAGDLIIYDWKDTGKGDDTTGHDHTGIITAAGEKNFTVIEGNKNNAVGKRTVTYNARYIRGFIACRFADEIKPPAPEPTTTAYKVKTNSGVPLRLRAEPNTKSAVLATMPNGSIVNVDSTANGWAHIPDYKGKAGYASLTYLKKV